VNQGAHARLQEARDLVAAPAGRGRKGLRDEIRSGKQKVAGDAAAEHVQEQLDRGVARVFLRHVLIP
jgi:hypothetical protein